LNRNRRSGPKYSLAVLVLVFAAGILQAQPAAAVKKVTFKGIIGQSRIGLTLVVNAANVITGGHYFYADELKDIPLKAGTQGTGVMLYGPDGGQMALRFKGSDGSTGQPVTLENSTGMEGRWMKGDSSYPINLQMEGISEGPADARWYEDVTSESDAAFENRVRCFTGAALAGDRATAARYVDFPLRVNRDGKSRTIASAAELSARWSRIFTPACLDAIRDAMPHDMFVRNGQAMLGDGVVWFGPKGATAINVPAN
jgi:hypothetical protein